MKYWVNVVSRTHVRNGVAGEFMQADHGKDTRLKRIAKPVQSFTAIGDVTDDAPHLAGANPETPAWRRRVRFRPCAETPVRPLIEGLEFIRNKKSWGVVFRRGFFEIGERDFEAIARAMGCEEAGCEK